MQSDVLAVICVSVFVPLAIGITLDLYEHDSAKNDSTFCRRADRSAANPMTATANTGAQATTLDWPRVNPRDLTLNAIKRLCKSRQFKLKTQELERRLSRFGRLALESTYFGSNRRGEMEQSRYPLGV